MKLLDIKMATQDDMKQHFLGKPEIPLIVNLHLMLELVCFLFWKKGVGYVECQDFGSIYINCCDFCYEQPMGPMTF